MKSLLKCALECGITIQVKPIDNKDTSSDPISYRLSVYSSSNDNKELAGKDIPWPSQEQRPNEISFSLEENSVHLKSPTTIAVIPLKLHSILGGSSVVVNDNTNVYKMFSTNPVTSFNSLALLSAVKKAVQNKDNTKLWKSVKKELASFEGQLCGVIPNSDQLLLLTALEDFQDETLLKDLCEVLSSHNVFNYRYQAKFYEICLDRKFFKILADTLDSNIILPEQVLGHLLKYAASLPDAKGFNVIEGLLKKGFSESAISMSGLTFSSTEFSKFVDWLGLVFNDDSKKHLIDTLLSLLASLIDSNCSGMIWDSEKHPHVLELMKVVGEMTTLCDSYFSLEVERTKKHAVQESDLPLYRIRKVNLASRKISW